MKSPVYLDYHSTTPVDSRVLEKMLPYFSEKFGNAASRTHRFGWLAGQAVEDAREQVAALLNCLGQEIIFTSGATEAVNLAIKGVWENYHEKGKHIVTVKTEHKAVLDTCEELEKRGADVTYLSVDREGMIDLNELDKSIRSDTVLVAIMLANNETGVVHPANEIAAIVHAKESIFMSDATQAIGKMHVDVQQEGIDLLCMSGHKMYGPKGVGALFVRRKNPRVSLHPQMHGGGHERGLRSGTLNVPAIVGLGKACEIAKLELWDDGIRLSKLRTILEQSLVELGGVHINGSIRNRLPNISNLAFSGVKADEIILKMPELAVSSGSACSSAIAEPSHVLKAMGLSNAEAYSTLRFSLGKYTNMEEITFSIAKVKEALALFRNPL